MLTEFFLSEEGRGLVPVFMKPQDGITLELVSFKVDTGSDITTISKEWLQLLGYSQNWIATNAVEDKGRTISRAGGKDEPAWYITIPIANFAERDMKNWPFYVRIEEGRDFPNLLGLDVLSNFNFTFDYDKGAFIVEQAENPRIVLPKFKNQEISFLTRNREEF